MARSMPRPSISSAQLVCILGDVHGDWAGLNTYINQRFRFSKPLRSLAASGVEVEALILQCGDFGYWPHTDPPHRWFSPGESADGGERCALRTDVDFLRDGRVKIYWCDGNHENHDALETLEAAHPGEAFVEVAPGVYFAPFGSVLTLLDGTRVMFCGGALSTDRRERALGHDWWKQEVIDESDMNRLPDPITTKVDWIISHTCPSSFRVRCWRYDGMKDLDPSRIHLERIREDFRPSRWWFGHYHCSGSGMIDDAIWVLLDYLGNPGGRKWKEEVLIERVADYRGEPIFNRKWKR